MKARGKDGVRMTNHAIHTYESVTDFVRILALRASLQLHWQRRKNLKMYNIKF